MLLQKLKQAWERFLEWFEIFEAREEWTFMATELKGFDVIEPFQIAVERTPAYCVVAWKEPRRYATGTTLEEAMTLLSEDVKDYLDTMWEYGDERCGMDVLNDREVFRAHLDI